MSNINDSTFTQEIQKKIDSITTASTAEEYLYTALAVKSQNKAVVNYVTTTNSLPDIFLCKVPNGHIVFVQDINVPVVANNDQWRGLDGRLLRSDAPIRELWTWGYNTNTGQGALGDGTTINKSSPISIIGGFIDWCCVSVGTITAAIRTNGTAWSWGCNGQGQLGDGTTTARSSPVKTVGGFTDWCQVSVGAPHTVGLRNNGTIWAWGGASSGTLGDGTAVNKSSPVSVVGGFTNWCKIYSGLYHTMALRSDGTLWTWGRNNAGMLGDGTTVNRSSPVSVIGVYTDWCQFSAGYHSVAIRSNGELWSWGCNRYGQLGNNATVNRSSPVSVVGGFNDWCNVSAGMNHTAAIRTNGELWAWGCNNSGVLGDNTTISKLSPVSVVGGFTNWCLVAVGRYHTLAIKSDGTLWGWGRNNTGHLGNGTTISRSSPVSVVGGFTDWCQISANRSSAAIRQYLV